MPRISDSEKTPFKPNKPCERQEPPDLSAGVGPPPQSAGTIPPPDVPSLLSNLPAKQIEKAAVSLGLPADTADELASLGEAAK